MYLEELNQIINESFKECGYEEVTARLIVSNRKDLCDYQCDDVFKVAKLYHTNPIAAGEAIVNNLNSKENIKDYFEKVEFVKPGFINFKLSNKFINRYVKLFNNNIKNSIKLPEVSETFVVDYGGPNVAKPLHVGHMRTAIVGESIKRIIEFMGHKTVSDVHLGDFGLQIGQVIYAVLEDGLDVDDIDIKYLDKTYPKMSAICKENEEIKEKCAEITLELQNGNEEYRRLWKKICEVSIADIKSNYDFLDVHFDYWYGESDAYPYLDKTTEILKENNCLVLSRGAEIVEVKEETDKLDIPPLLFKKSNGAYLYASTDIATIVQRMEDYNPDHILYITDLRQALHFEQVFRASAKAKIIEKDKLEHLGYGTVNGEDGKPYKTRSGNTPKLENLFTDAKEIFINQKETNKDMSEEDVNKIVNAILKFADLQNSRDRDYIFDLNKFSEVTGKTGPYLLYTYLRINKIIKDEEITLNLTDTIYNEYDRDLRLKLLEVGNAINLAFVERKPSYIADYLYNLAVEANTFYQHNYLTNLEDKTKKDDWIFVLATTNKIIKELLNLLIIDIPSVM